MILWEKGAHEVALREVSTDLAGRPFFTATIQRQFVARAVLRNPRGATRDADFVREVLPPIRRFFRWLKGECATRTTTGSSRSFSGRVGASMRVLSTTRSWASRRSPPKRRSRNSSARMLQRLYDAYAPYRSEPARIPTLDVFTWEDVMVNAIYADGLRCLAQAHGDRRRSAHEADEFAARATRVRQALETNAWWTTTRGVFWDLAGWAEKRGPNPHVQLLFPLILRGSANPRNDQANDSWHEHLLNEKEFWLPYPIRASAPASGPFRFRDGAAKTTWSGPTVDQRDLVSVLGTRDSGRRRPSRKKQSSSGRSRVIAEAVSVESTTPHGDGEGAS